VGIHDARDAPPTRSGTRSSERTSAIEFRNVPQGLEIADESATAIQVQLRTSAWIFDAIRFTALVARFDLAGAQEGSHAIVVERRALNVPPGVSVERLSPQKTDRASRPQEGLTVRPTRETPRN